MYKAILTSTVIPIDGTYKVETLKNIPDMQGILHYVGHPSTREIIEKMGAVKASSYLFEGLQVGESALVVSIQQGKSSRASTGITVDQSVQLEDLSFRVLTRLA